ncbi:MAG: hypothetical protein ABIH85_07310 [Candidatus Omnitrophota bacterium]
MRRSGEILKSFGKKGFLKLKMAKKKGLNIFMLKKYQILLSPGKQ